jgi:Fe-S-cluster-containing hydrogenase component 2
MASNRSYSLISVDEKKCVGCRICEIVCSQSKEGKINPSRSRIRVYSLPSHIDIPLLCRQCSDAPCLEACPEDAISRKQNNVIMVDEDSCTGCGLCVEACPFNSVFLNPEKNVAKICDMCNGKPLCVKYCPTECIIYTAWEESLEAKRGSEKKLYEDLLLGVKR